MSDTSELTCFMVIWSNLRHYFCIFQIIRDRAEFYLQNKACRPATKQTSATPACSRTITKKGRLRFEFHRLCSGKYKILFQILRCYHTYCKSCLELYMYQDNVITCLACGQTTPAERWALGNVTFSILQHPTFIIQIIDSIYIYLHSLEEGRVFIN